MMKLALALAVPLLVAALDQPRSVPGGTKETAAQAAGATVTITLVRWPFT